jgi:TolA-binding protein
MAVSAPGASAQPADPALDLLQQGQKAFAARDFNGAAQRYGDFVQKFPVHAQISPARFGLGLSLLQSGEPDAAKIAALLAPAADDATFSERPDAIYWCGAALRQAGQFDAAARRFAQAADHHAARAKGWTDSGQGVLPPGIESLARSRCDQAEALLAAGKAQDARAAAEALSREPWLVRSRSRDLVHYLLGCAAYASGDLVIAGRTLVRLAPFEQPLLGPHARYLLARIHHVAGESTEAAEHYDAVPAACEKQTQAAKQALQANAEPVRDHPLERARLRKAVAAPPEYLADALYYGGVLLYEQKKYVEALVKLVRVSEGFPKHAQAGEARLLQGLCHVQRGQHADAVKALQPLLGHAKLGAQARAWTARALVRGADPAQPRPFKQALDQAAEHLRQAAAQDPELLFELADTLRRAGRHGEAAPVYQKLAGGPRGEEARARLIACSQLAGKGQETDEAFVQFEKDHPRSAFLPEALYHYAENAFAIAQDAPEASRRPLLEGAVRRYERLVSKYPDLPQADLCRYRMAMARHALGQYAEAAAALAAISDAGRSGALAGSSYVMADALLRAGPPAHQAKDAISAAQRLQQFTLAIQALQAFIAARQGAPEIPEAMIKLGYCYQQVASLHAVPEERVKAATAGRELYESVRASFPEHPLRAVAEYERANCYVLAGDPATGLSKLVRFHGEPFVRQPIAPVAILRQAQIMRSMGQAGEAANVLAACRQRHEEELKKDKTRASMVPLIRYHHGLALREAKRPAEAVQVLQSVVQEYADSEWAKASRELMEETKP